VRKNSGIDMKWRLHDLRHRSSTVFIGQGHDVRTVAGGPGYSDPGDDPVGLRPRIRRRRPSPHRWLG